VRDAGDVHVDALAVEGDALGHQVFALPLPHREAPVGADDAPPRDVRGMLLGREKAGAEARRSRRDVAVGPYESLRDLPDRIDDRQVSIVVGDDRISSAFCQPTPDDC
jgi:hypothetical protein